jgi:hypothetical protein
MSAMQRVTSPTFGPAATTRVAGSGRNVAVVSFQRVDDLGGSNAMGPQEQSVRYDDGYQPPQEKEGRGEGRKRLFPDYFSYAPVNHLDEIMEFSDWSEPSIFLPDEVMRGVGRYESNMRVIAGIDAVGGETINRLF